MTSDQQVHMHRIKGPDHVMFIETWSNRCGITYVTTAPDTTVVSGAVVTFPGLRCCARSRSPIR